MLTDIAGSERRRKSILGKFPAAHQGDALAAALRQLRWFLI
jgi:hypothetical protein